MLISHRNHFNVDLPPITKVGARVLVKKFTSYPLINLLLSVNKSNRL